MARMKRRTVLLASGAIACAIGWQPAKAQTSNSADSGQAATVGDRAPAGASPNAQGGSATQAVAVGPSGTATAKQTGSPPASQTYAGEIIVTAQKRAQSINNVGLSITAVSSDVLASRGVNDPSQLTKLVSGFNFNQTASGNPVYTIRGVGYQDSSIASSPAVTVYVDEVPIPYSSATLGASLDVERVEVLKGPQGTLYGGNSTGGAINYIAAKPTDKFTAGANWDFGRFATSDLSGYVGGPITDTLSVRVSGRWLKGEGWQKSYTRDDTMGAQNQLYGRIIADWRPIDKLKIELSANGWQDHSESEAAQLISKQGAIPGIPLDPGFVAYPFPPHNDRAADWDPGVNFHHRDNFKQVTGRIEYAITDNLAVTSLSSYEVYNRYSPNDFDGTSRPVLLQISQGGIKTFFQELRASLAVAGTGNVTVGGNYDHDTTNETDQLIGPAGTPRIFGDDFESFNKQRANSKAVFASGDIPIVDRLSAVAGIRYSSIDRDYSGCSKDSGDGLAAAAFNGLFGLNVLPGQCYTIQLPSGQPGLFNDRLDENSVSWRGGLNYKPVHDILLYANVSRGYKGGAFQSLPSATSTTLAPVVQERLTAYEIGFKAGLFNRMLQLNGAAFYYDYRNKQVRSLLTDPLLGPVEGLVNIPKSRIQGFELSANLRPMRGLTISSSITLTDSKVRGSFIGISQSSQVSDFRGEAFPYTPKWSGNTDAEYRWALNERYQAVLGATASYETSTNGGFGEDPVYRVRGYALLDLRAEIEVDGGKWRVGVFGRNVTNQYYWNTATRASDAGTRFAGMPATYGINLGFRY